MTFSGDLNYPLESLKEAKRERASRRVLETSRSFLLVLSVTLKQLSNLSRKKQPGHLLSAGALSAVGSRKRADSSMAHARHREAGGKCEGQGGGRI